MVEIQFFYNRLQPNTKIIIDAAADEALTRKNLECARKLLDEISSNLIWQSTRGHQRRSQEYMRSIPYRQFKHNWQ